ncbi:DUF1971 domain-containing protein [Roseateles sp. BYS180W]|uniref:DUF1971 domain-containing protein n=1 Tax=Roseateles rivi TaxID=3299028 RepID=A0ABW7FRD7_9BURK
MTPRPPHAPTLPAGLQAYRRTPEFTRDSLPAGLLRDHHTRAGTWALIHVLQGQLWYRVPGIAWQELLTPESAPGVIRPEELHSVAPEGEVRFYVEFLTQPEVGAQHERPSTGLL